eukprot:7169345-Pyramimonas_sp.AAC.1
MTGPVSPRVEAIRNQRDSALRQIAKFVEDPTFALLSELDKEEGTFDLAREFLRAEIHSNDIPEGFIPQPFKCLTQLLVGADDPNNPAALGSADFWRPQSYRVDEFARHV